MSICWYCYWGWPKPVQDIYEKYLELAGEHAMHFGPAHIVWEDENFEHAESCIKWCDDREWCEGLTDVEVSLVRQSLVELLALPESVRCCEPEDYDGENPESFPPPEGLEMVGGLK